MNLGYVFFLKTITLDCAIYRLPLRSTCKGKGKGWGKGERRKDKGETMWGSPIWRGSHPLPCGWSVHQPLLRHVAWHKVDTGPDPRLQLVACIHDLTRAHCSSLFFEVMLLSSGGGDSWATAHGKLKTNVGTDLDLVLEEMGLPTDGITVYGNQSGSLKAKLAMDYDLHVVPADKSLNELFPRKIPSLGTEVQ